MPDTPSYSVLEQLLRDAGCPLDVAEVHGQYCGLACVLGDGAAVPWLADIRESCDVPEADLDGVGSLIGASCMAMASCDLSFSPCLPSDDEPLADRAMALGAWCRGFTAGLATAAGDRGVMPRLDDSETSEIIADFTEIARAWAGIDDGEAGAEAAYAELVEYVRVGVQLVFEAMHDLRGAGPRPVLH